jgi:hypothetical protein
MKKILQNRFSPFITVAILVVLNLMFIQGLVLCKIGVKCEAVNGVLISDVAKMPLSLKDDPEILSGRQDQLNQLNGRVNAKQGELNQVDRAIAEKKKAGAGAQISTPAGAKLNDELAVLQAQRGGLDDELKAVTTERDNVAAGILNIRKNIAARYSNRLMWSFMAAVFFILCWAAIVIACFTMAAAKVDTKLWIGATTVVAVIIAATLYISVYFTDAHYMAVILPMFRSSFLRYGDLELWPINFLNVLAFAAITFLLVASASVLASVRSIERDGLAPEALDEPARERRIDEYADQLKNLKAILYVAALMLFAGVLHLKLLEDWHLLFISTNPEHESVKLLAGYFKQAVSVQAGFYAVMLAVVYLPVAYVIKERASDLARFSTLTPEAKTKLLDQYGMSFSLKDLWPRLITILSPFLAGPILEIFNSLSRR